ncbi:MAG: exodeoxyribonuclease VII large subunit [Gammaproteobacteria bacterium]
MQDTPATAVPEPAVLSVTSLNRLARSLLESNFPAVLVEGEISNLATPASGHWYLTLKDESSQLRCAMFAGRNRLVRFKPGNGQQVLVRGRLSIYEARGDYQLILDSMEEAGAGALRRAFELLKAKLQAEGLFDAAAKQEVHDGFRHIGIVTSPSGAVIRDIVSVFARRFPAIRLTVFPVTVQGATAPQEICRAIELANALAPRLGIDALILARGGGSLEDLQAFNEESVARAIFRSELPLTSAVGHETDFTIADFVADLRAPTPSAAAELMSPSQQEYVDTFRAYAEQFEQLLRNQLLQGQQRLQWLVKRLQRPDRRLQQRAQFLDGLDLRLRRAMAVNLNQQGHRLRQYHDRLMSHSPRAGLQRLLLTNDNLAQRLRQALGGLLKSRRARLAELSRGLHAVSPLNTLARGYSISFNGAGEVIRDAATLRVGDPLVTRLHRGRVSARVEKVEPSAAGADNKE